LTTSRAAVFRAEDSSGYDDTSEEEEEEEATSRKGTGGWSAMLGSPWTWGFGGKVAPVGATTDKTDTDDAHAASTSLTPSPDGPEVRHHKPITVPVKHATPRASFEST